MPCGGDSDAVEEEAAGVPKHHGAGHETSVDPEVAVGPPLRALKVDPVAQEIVDACNEKKIINK